MKAEADLLLRSSEKKMRTDIEDAGSALQKDMNRSSESSPYGTNQEDGSSTKGGSTTSSESTGLRQKVKITHEDKILDIKHLEKLSLGPNDILLIQPSKELGPQHFHRLLQWAGKWVQERNKRLPEAPIEIMVLPHELNLMVLQKRLSAPCDAGDRDPSEDSVGGSSQ